MKRECGMEMVYGGVWEGRIVRCLVSCFECLSGQSRLTYFCFDDSGRFLLSGNYRVSSLTNNGVFCGEFGEVGSFLDPGSSLFRSEGLWNESRVYEVKVLLDGR